MKINITTLREMVKTYVMMSAIEHGMNWEEYTLIYDNDNDNDVFYFNYVLSFNNYRLENNLKLSKYDIIKILNYCIRNDEQIVSGYNILNSENDELSVFVCLEKIKNKQLVKRNNYEV